MLSWTYLRLGHTTYVALVQASLPTRTNQLHVNPRDSISGFLQSRFTNNEQKNWTNAVPQQGFGQQCAAVPNKLRRYARMHTCNPWPVLEHMAQTHASRLTIFICWAFSSAQVPSEMIILTLPRRESFWFSLCQQENLLEAKPVDVRLHRKEGREGKSFSDLVRRKQRLVTAKQFSLPRICSDSVVRRPWKGAQTSCHQQTTQEAKRKCCHELDERFRVVWVDARLVASAAMMTRSAPAIQLIWRSTCTTRHEHSFWARSSRIRYGHIQTKLTFICGFSLTPPPLPLRYLSVAIWCRSRHSVILEINFRHHVFGRHPGLSSPVDYSREEDARDHIEREDVHEVGEHERPRRVESIAYFTVHQATEWRNWNGAGEITSFNVWTFTLTNTRSNRPFA